MTEVIKADTETRQIVLVRLANFRDQLSLSTAFLLGPQHCRSAMGVIGAEITHLVATQFLKPNPNIGLNRLHQVTEVDVPIDVWKC